MKSQTEFSRRYFALSPSVAWQSIGDRDLLFLVDYRSHQFYYFQDSSRFMMERIIEGDSPQDVFSSCISQYSVKEESLKTFVDEFIQTLLREGIIYECKNS